MRLRNASAAAIPVPNATLTCAAVEIADITIPMPTTSATKPKRTGSGKRIAPITVTISSRGVEPGEEASRIALRMREPASMTFSRSRVEH